MTAPAGSDINSSTTSARTGLRGPRSFRHTVLRCTSGLVDRPHLEGRCQLLAGHTGPHAVVFLDADARRTVRSWSPAAPEAWADSWTAFQRPWALGFPAPTWSVV